MRCFSAKEEGEYLFVYGVLRKGSKRPIRRVLARQADFIGEAVFQGCLYSLGAFPGATPSANPRDRVHGEVYRLCRNKALFRRLDEYEGYLPAARTESLFRRERVPVRLRNGKTAIAWAYFYNRPTDGLNPIPSGRWVIHDGS